MPHCGWVASAPTAQWQDQTPPTKCRFRTLGTLSASNRARLKPCPTVGGSLQHPPRNGRTKHPPRNAASGHSGPYPRSTGLASCQNGFRLRTNPNCGTSPPAEASPPLLRVGGEFYKLIQTPPLQAGEGDSRRCRGWRGSNPVFLSATKPPNSA
ncbi:hypothetical protein J3R74_003039 [Puniceicoccus vermicola]